MTAALLPDATIMVRSAFAIRTALLTLVFRSAIRRDKINETRNIYSPRPARHCASMTSCLIMCTGGLYRRVPHDRHRNEPSSFHIGVSRGRRMASSGMLARVLQRLHSISIQP